VCQIILLFYRLLVIVHNFQVDAVEFEKDSIPYNFVLHVESKARRLLKLIIIVFSIGEPMLFLVL